MLPGETVRETYRRQGEQRLKDTIVRNILDDAVISTTVDVKLLERIVAIVEAGRGA